MLCSPLHDPPPPCCSHHTPLHVDPHRLRLSSCYHQTPFPPAQPSHSHAKTTTRIGASTTSAAEGGGAKAPWYTVPVPLRHAHTHGRPTEPREGAAQRAGQAGRHRRPQAACQPWARALGRSSGVLALLQAAMGTGALAFKCIHRKLEESEPQGPIRGMGTERL